MAECKKMISALPGGDATAEEQEEKMAIEVRRHDRKRSLLQKYKTLEVLGHASSATEVTIADNTEPAEGQVGQKRKRG